MPQLQKSEYPEYYHKYVELVGERDPLEVLKDQRTQQFWHELPPDKDDYRYAEGKWTPKELLGHVIDCERIMAYRALSIARGETQPLPGFDENMYVENANFGERKVESLTMELHFVRASTIMLFAGMNDEILLKTGIANGNPVSVRALLYIIAGHELHHVNILKERYL